MELNYKTSEQGYFEYVVQYSKHSQVGKSARRRFYTGFSLLYLLVSVVSLIYVLVKNMIPVPYFFMFIIIYVVLMFYMMFIDINSIGALKKARKYLSENKVDFDKPVKITQTDMEITICENTNCNSYKIDDILNLTESNDYIVLFITELVGYSIPKSSFRDSINLNTFKALFAKSKGKK